MKFSRRLSALLLLGVLSMSVLPGCSSSAAVLSDSPAPTPAASAAPTPEPTPEPTSTPTPTPAPEPTPEPYDYTQPAPETAEVGEEWFQDAVFIGDSRTDGLRLYSGIKGVDFICYKGLTAFEFDNKKCISSGEGKITALEALQAKPYAKVYVMLGLNELGYSVDAFAEGYAALMDAVREAQPDAVLYFQSVVPINPQKAKEKNQPSYITNEKVAAFNAEISRLCEEKQAVYLNVAEALTDENGELPYDKASDGIHFTKDWYQQWYAYLKTHTVDPDTLEVPAHEEDPVPSEVPAAPAASAESVALGLRK